MKANEEEIIFADTRDGISLIGAVFRPLPSPQSRTGIVFIHGNTGKFCDYPYVLISRHLADLGYTVVNGNTRGHDISATLWKLDGEEVAGGSAWEVYEDSPYDLAAWIDYASSIGLEQAVLVGHSLGAAKVVYYQSQRQDPRVQGVILASPDLHGHWSAELVAEARRLVDLGKGEELLPAIMGAYWYRLSARNIASRAEVLSTIYSGEKPWISRVTCPILALFGASGDVGGESELQTIQQNASGTTRLTTELIEGADHVYTNHERQFADLVSAWVKTL